MNINSASYLCNDGFPICYKTCSVTDLFWSFFEIVYLLLWCVFMLLFYFILFACECIYSRHFVSIPVSFALLLEIGVKYLLFVRYARFFPLHFMSSVSTNKYSVFPHFMDFCTHIYTHITETYKASLPFFVRKFAFAYVTKLS